MKTTIQVANIKRYGCVNSIHEALTSIIGVFGVNVNGVSGEITVDYTDEVSHKQLMAKLSSLAGQEECKAKV